MSSFADFDGRLAEALLSAIDDRSDDVVFHERLYNEAPRLVAVELSRRDLVDKEAVASSLPLGRE